MRGKRGFTLAEIMVVTSITGILLAIATPGLQRAQLKAREAKAKADLKMIRDAMEMAQNDTGLYPHPFQLDDATPSGAGYPNIEPWRGPAAAFTPATWRGPYLKRVPTVDPMFMHNHGGGWTDPETGWIFDSYSIPGLPAVRLPSANVSTEGTPYNTW